MARALHAWLVGLLVSCAVADADPIDRRSAVELTASAQAAFRSLRYADAVGLLDRAWRRGESDPEQLRAIFALAGRAAASMGRDTAAVLWFQRWLCLEPGAALPAGSSPKLQVVLGRARDRLGGEALSVRAVRGPANIEVTIRDPLALAASVRAGGMRTLVTSPRLLLATTSGAAEVLDAYGNVLVTTKIEVPAAVAAPSEPVTSPEQTGSSRWWTWALGAGGFATISGVAWWVADDADYQAHETGDEAEASSFKRRRDLATWISRGALVGAGICVVAGVVVYVRGREHRVIATPQPGGASVAWRVSF